MIAWTCSVAASQTRIARGAPWPFLRVLHLELGSAAANYFTHEDVAQLILLHLQLLTTHLKICTSPTLMRRLSV